MIASPQEKEAKAATMLPIATRLRRLSDEARAMAVVEMLGSSAVGPSDRRQAADPLWR